MVGSGRFVRWGALVLSVLVFSMLPASVMAAESSTAQGSEAQGEGPPPGDPPPMPPPPLGEGATGDQELPLPPPPIFNSVEATSSTSVTVTFWPQDGIGIYTVSYRLNRSSLPFSNKSEPVTSSGLTTVVITGLQCGREYEFWAWSFGDGEKRAREFHGVEAVGPRLATPECEPPPQNRPPVVTGPSSVNYGENGTASVAVYTATDPDGDPVSWGLQGTDAARFRISGGTLRFASPPDYETPADANGDNAYAVTVTARDGRGGVDTAAVTVRVTNAEEAGAITFLPTTPQAGTVITATLTDPDGGIRNLSWQWQRLDTGWGDISGATAASYTPAAADVGHQLRAVASYDDGHGTGKRAMSAATDAVAAPTLPTPDAPTALMATATGPTTIDLTWNSPSGIARHEVRRREGAAGPWITVSAQIQGMSHTVTGLKPSTEYFFTVRAFGDGMTYAAAWSQTSFLDSATTPGPVIEVALGVGTSDVIDEGDYADFAIVADPAPIADLIVDLDVDLVGAFFSGQAPPSVTIDAGKQLASIRIQTVYDMEDEANGSITVTVSDSQSDAYSLGMKSSVSVTVEDDDEPPPSPTVTLESTGYYPAVDEWVTLSVKTELSGAALDYGIDARSTQGGNWTEIAQGSSVGVRLTAAGVREYRARARPTGGGAWTTSETLSVSWGVRPNWVRPNGSCGFLQSVLQLRISYDVVVASPSGDVEILQQAESDYFSWNGYATCVRARFTSNAGTADITGNLYVGELELADNKTTKDTIEQGVANNNLTLNALAGLYRLEYDSTPRVSAECDNCGSVETNNVFVDYAYLKHTVIRVSGSYFTASGGGLSLLPEVTWTAPTSALPPISCGANAFSTRSTTVRGAAFDFLAWVVTELVSAYLCTNDYRRALDTELRYDLPGLRENIADSIIKDRFITFGF